MVVAVLVLAAGLVAWALIGAKGPATLPQGAKLSAEALVWTAVEGDTEQAFVGDPEVDHTPLPLDGLVKAPTLTADRRTVLYLSYVGDRKVDTLWAAGTGGEDPRRIVDDDSRCPSVGRPSVSPDGTMVALPCRTRSGSAQNLQGIRIYSIGGKLLRTLDDEHVVSAPTWTADGRWVVYSRQTAAGSDLYAAAADEEDAAPVRLTTGDTLDELAVVTPDGSTLVFVRRASPGADGVLYRTDLEVTDATIRAPREPQPMMVRDTPISGSQPAVSPDGTELLYLEGGYAWTTPLVPVATSEPDRVLSDVNGIAWARR
jgi:Tol biopolymer transport system component